MVIANGLMLKAKLVRLAVLFGLMIQHDVLHVLYWPLIHWIFILGLINYYVAMHWLSRFSLLMVWGAFGALIAPSAFGQNDCDRLCQAQASVAVSPSPWVMDQLESEMEVWAALLMDLQDPPTYLTYMDSYQWLAPNSLNRYVARYTRRQFRSSELSKLFDLTKQPKNTRLAKEVRESFEVSEQEVEQYIRTLMWIRMREERRYLVQRFDQAFGLSNFSHLVRTHSRAFVGEYMVNQAERWAFGVTSLEEKALKHQIDQWLVAEMDIEAQTFQSENYRDTINRLTYAFKNVSDDELRLAIQFYQDESYQKMLTIMEKAILLHFQRIRSKNNLSDLD